MNDRANTYHNLLWYLFNREFIYTIDLDENRAVDGYNLRRRFAIECDRNDLLDYMTNKPCSILEMMVALADRCEESIMVDPDLGDRSDEWFWGMIENLGLGRMYDDRYDDKYVEEVIDIFLKRDYKSNGEGGLFTINNPRSDVRTVEIWYQLCWYLNELLEKE